MDIDKLHEWADSIDSEIQSLKEKIQALNAELQRKMQQADLVRKLIDCSGNCNSLGDATRPVSAPELSSLRAATPTMVKDCVYQILAEAHRAMNINEIHSEFVRRGYSIPGKGTPFNILVHIGRELRLGKKARFRRVGRGTYALKGAYQE